MELDWFPTLISLARGAQLLPDQAPPAPVSERADVFTQAYIRLFEWPSAGHAGPMAP